MLSTFQRNKPGAYLAAFLLVSVTLIPVAGCHALKESKDTLFIGTFPMGERVQVGPLIYTVLEAQWKSQLSDDPKSKIPKNRYLLLKMTVTNSGKEETTLPQLTLQNSAGQSFPEVTEGVDEVPQWYGALIRTLKPAQTEPGVIV